MNNRFFKDGRLEKAYFNHKGQAVLSNHWRLTANHNLIFIKESKEGFPYRALVFTPGHQVYSGSYYPSNEVVTSLREVEDMTFVSSEDECMIDINWREGTQLQNENVFYQANHEGPFLDTGSYCNLENGKSGAEVLDEFYDMIYHKLELQLEVHTLLTLEKHSSHLGPVSSDHCVQIIHDIKVDLEHKNGTAKILGKKNEVETDDVRIQFRNLFIDGQGRLHGFHTILVKNTGSNSQRRDPLMQWTVGHSISGTWNHGILEGIVTIYNTKDKLIAVEGMVKENCFHGPVIVINVQLAQVL